MAKNKFGGLKTRIKGPLAQNPYSKANNTTVILIQDCLLEVLVEDQFFNFKSSKLWKLA